MWESEKVTSMLIFQVEKNCFMESLNGPPREHNKRAKIEHVCLNIWSDFNLRSLYSKSVWPPSLKQTRNFMNFCAETICQCTDENE